MTALFIAAIVVHVVTSVLILVGFHQTKQSQRDLRILGCAVIVANIVATVGWSFALAAQ